MFISRTISSVLLLIAIFLASLNENFFKFFFIHLFSFFLNWEFLRLINFYNCKYKTNNEKINNFLLTKSRLLKSDYILIFTLQFFIFFYGNIFFLLFLFFFCAIKRFIFQDMYIIIKILGLSYLSLPFFYLLNFDTYAILLENLIFFSIIVISTDLGGFIFGKIVKGPKINKKISPNKTWAGFFGGIFLSSFFVYLFFSKIGLEFFLVISCLSIVCQIGDFMESYLKRKCIVKESSNLIPGHGGILDRLDGAIFLLNVMLIFNYFGISFFNYIKS